MRKHVLTTDHLRIGNQGVLLIAVGLLSISQITCVQYNECLSSTGDRIGQAAIDFDIRRSVVRTQETPVGNVVADALFDAAQRYCETGANPCPDFALQNAGGIRPETSCGLRDEIPSGPIFEQDVIDLLPFENELAVVRLTGTDIKLALEHAVSQLGQSGESAQAGYFLQVSHLQFNVDCSQEAQVPRADGSGLAQQGSRIQGIHYEQNGDLIPLDEEQEYEVAINTYIASGNDGFLAFLLRNGTELILDDDDNPIPKFNEDQDHVRTNAGAIYTDQQAVVDQFIISAAQDSALGRPPENRIQLNNNCFLGQ